MPRQVEVVVAQKHPVQAGDIGCHVTAGRGDDAARPRHDMIGTEDEAVGTGEAEMIAGMSRRVDRSHSRDRIAIPQQDVGREGGIGAEMESIGGCAGACLEGSGRAEMVRMGVTEKDSRDLP